MDMWTVFPTTKYTVVELAQGGIFGNTIESTQEADGIFKERNGKIINGSNMETIDTSATLHIRPTEAFLSARGNNMVGEGISVSKNGGATQLYRVIGQVEGYDYASNQLSFYRLTLSPESATSYEES